MMELAYIYILIGLIGGITAGMLGLGGGIIFVPGLLLVHKFSGLFDGYQLQSAVYTSLICIIFAGSTSSYLCLLYTSPSPRDVEESRMPSSA